MKRGIGVLGLLLAVGIAAQPVFAQDLRSDFDQSGRVDFADFLLFASAYGGGDPVFDLDGDGRVAFPDFLLFASDFGKGTDRKSVV